MLKNHAASYADDDLKAAKLPPLSLGKTHPHTFALKTVI